MARAKVTIEEPQCIRTGALTFFKMNDEWVVRRGYSSLPQSERKRLKTEYQATWRNLQRVWKAFGGELKGTFEFREGRQLDYHKFLSLNLNPPVVTLTEEQAEKGQTLAGPYWVSQGSVQPAVDVRIEDGMFLSNLRPEALRRNEQVRFVLLQQMSGGWVAGRVIPLKSSQFTLHNGCIAMPWSEGQWGTFVRVRQRRDKNLEVTTQRLVGQMNTEK